jgi:hypothetical protein
MLIRRSFDTRTFTRATGARRASVVAALVLALLADPAIAQTAERPGIRVGDRWQFAVYYTVPSTTPNRTWTVTAVTPVRIEGTENGEPLLLTPDLNVLESPVQKNSHPAALRFPLEVGKRWRHANDWVFKPRGSNGTLVVDVEVTGYEKIRVAAGEFDAFKLVSTGSVGGTSPIGSQYGGVITTTYWYAPAARAIVKSVSHNPYLGTSTVELVELELRP